MYSLPAEPLIEPFGIPGGIDFQPNETEATGIALDLPHENPTEATPLQPGLDRNKPDNAEALVDNIQPGSPYRRVIMHEEQRMVAGKAVVGMLFVIAAQAPILPKNPLAYAVI